MVQSSFRPSVARRTTLAAWGTPALIVWLLAGGTAGTCAQTIRPDQLAGGGIEVRRIERAEMAHTSGGVVLAPGDFVIESPDMRVIVGGLAREGDARGAVLEVARASGTDPVDGVVLLAPRLFAGGDGARVVPDRIFPVMRQGRAALRIEGHARVGSAQVAVAQELAVGGGGQWLSWAVRVDGAERVVRGLRAGARLGWGGAIPFAPGVGELSDVSWHETSWVGREGVDVSAAVGRQEGVLRVRARFEEHGEERLLAHTDVTGSAHTLAPNRVVRERFTLALVPGGLTEAVRRLGWARGAPFPEVTAMLPYIPAGARAHVRTADGEPIIEGRPDAEGRVILPLTPARSGTPAPVHEIVATAYGHAPTDPVRVTEPDVVVHLPIPRGGRVRVTVAEGQGTPMPGRFRILGVGETPSPELGPDWRAAGALDTVVTVEGDEVVPVEPGTYRIRVSRGIEWSVVDEQVEVTESFRPHVRAELEHLIDPGEWVGCDFHLHATPSPDSEVSIEDRVATLVAEGVRFAVPTDHNHVTDYGPSVSALSLEDFGTVPGVEVTTWGPQFGHFNAYPYPIDASRPGNGAPRHQRTTPAELFSALRSVDPDMVVQVSHPRLEPNIGYFDLTGLDPATGTGSDLYSDDYDVVEVFNGFDIARPSYVERVFADWLALVASGRRVVANGSSDSHLVRFQWAGYPRTYVRVPGGEIHDGRAITDALKAGRAFVTSGPFVELDVEGRSLGETVQPHQGRVAVRVRVRAAPWIDVSSVDLYVGAKLDRTMHIPTAASEGPDGRPVLRLDHTVELGVEGDTFIVAWVRGDEPLDDHFGREGVYPLAFTNPIWIDGDGDGDTPWSTAP